LLTDNIKMESSKQINTYGDRHFWKQKQKTETILLNIEKDKTGKIRSIAK